MGAKRVLSDRLAPTRRPCLGAAGRARVEHGAHTNIGGTRVESRIPRRRTIKPTKICVPMEMPVAPLIRSYNCRQVPARRLSGQTPPPPGTHPNARLMSTEAGIEAHSIVDTTPKRKQPSDIADDRKRVEGAGGNATDRSTRGADKTRTTSRSAASGTEGARIPLGEQLQLLA